MSFAPMTKRLDQFSDEVWFKFFDWVSTAADTETLTDEEVSRTLEQSGIDVSQAHLRIRKALQKAQEKDKMQPRQEVLDFAEAMEEKLRKNDWKRHWSRVRPAELFRLLWHEVLELRDCELSHRRSKYRDAMIRDECLDVANFAMMLWDKHR